MTTVNARDLGIALGKATTLIEALPWLTAAHGGTVVLTTAGAGLENAESRRALAADLVFLRHVGMPPVMVVDGAQSEPLIDLVNDHGPFAVSLSAGATAAAVAGIVHTGRIPVLRADAGPADACALAVALRARKLVVLDERAPTAHIAADDPLAAIDPRLAPLLTAVQGGVAAAHLVDGRVPHAILLEIFAPAGFGLTVTAR